MDQCASVLLAFPPRSNLADNETYHKAASAHIQRLSRMLKERAKDIVAYSASLFEVVDPAVNSLSYLTILHALLFPSPASSVPQDLILEKLVIFMLKFDGRQCRYAGLLLLDLMEAVGSGRLLPPSVAVETLAAAILKLDPTGTMLTSSHLLLTRLAYDTDNIQPALSVIDKDIVFYPGMANHDNAQYLCDLELSPPSYISKNTGLTSLLRSSMVLEYDLVCGMMYCARREWEKARTAFERVVTFPTKDGGCSKIMVEAFKKWILVSLLSEGRHSTTLPYASAWTTKCLGILGRPYVCLATAFATDDIQQLKLEADHNAQVWRDDGNIGLIQEVMAAYQKWRVLSLQDIYTKISISEIRQQTKSAETGAALNTDEDVEALIQNMIIAGMLKGVVEKNDDGTKFLNFLSPTTHLSEEEFSVETQRAVRKLRELNTIFHAVNQRLGTSKEYIKWAVKDSKRDKASEAQDPTLGFEAQIDDEDLMGSVSKI
ncbi:cop9 subunit [Xylaria cf. heliscus]|nr:cop9 subunit [Xylaria cf. heliscus]